MTDLPNTINESMLDALKTADQIVHEAFALRDQEQNLKDEAQAERVRAAEAKKKRRRALWNSTWMFLVFYYGALAISGLCVLIILGIDGAQSDVGATVWIVASFALTIAASVIRFIYMYKKRKDLEHLAKADALEVEAAKKSAEVDELLEQRGKYVAIIAPEYRFPIASEELLKIIRQGRANTLPEAYDKLELKLHQLKMEENMGKVIELQKSNLALNLIGLQYLKDIESNTLWS